MDPKALRGVIELMAAFDLKTEFLQVTVDRMRAQPLWYLVHEAPLDKKLASMQLLMDHFLKGEEYESCLVIHTIRQMVEKHDATWRFATELCQKGEHDASVPHRGNAA